MVDFNNVCLSVPNVSIQVQSGLHTGFFMGERGEGRGILKDTLLCGMQLR